MTGSSASVSWPHWRFCWHRGPHWPHCCGKKEAFARSQALAFDLERSELARQAADARLHLLAAQVAPHFLFNTLANVQALVDAQSPRAADVLRSLTAYLRAAVPRLHESVHHTRAGGGIGAGRLWS